MEPRILTYKGNASHIVGEVKGPGRNGMMFVATDAVYNNETNETKVEFDPVLAQQMGFPT